MSTGSNNIVVQVTDGVDATIAPKIREIGQAASNSASALNQLQTALNMVGGNTIKLNQTIQQLTPNLNNATGGTSRLTGALAQLAARVLGAEAGFGMMGGALGRVGVAAGIAGPLIVAALSVGAVVAAILVYEKFEESARKLTETQIALGNQFAAQRTNLLDLQEELTGLTQGPLAKYAQSLRDLPYKQITDNIANINKELQEQQSILATSGSLIERYGLGLNAHSGGTTQAYQPEPFTLQQSQDFISQSERDRVGNTDQLKGLQDDLTKVGQKLVELHNLEQSQNGLTLSITEASRKGIQDYYTSLLNDFKEYQAKKNILQKGADGELLSEQRRAAEEELRGFNEQLSKLKTDANGVVSPQQTLALRQQQLGQFDREHPGDQNQSSPFAQARDTLVKDVGNAQQAIDRQNRSLDQLVQKYKDEAQGSENYSVALRTEIEQRKAAAEVSRIAPDNANSANSLAQINALIAAKVRDAETSKEEIAIYNEFEGPLLRYNAALDASNRLLSAGAISSNQAAIAKAAASRAETDALNPLNEYVIGLEHEIALFGQYGTALTVATEVDRVRQELQKQGRDLTAQEVSTLTTYLTQLERQKQLQEDINALYSQNADTVQRLVIQQQALNQAKQQGIISETQYKIGLANSNVALADQANLDGRTATLQTQLVGALGKVTQGYQGLAKGLSDAYGQAFKTIADGAANSLGRAIAYGEDLGKALTDVARTVVSQLISAFVKLGIQWLVTQAIGSTLGKTAVLATIAQAEALAAALAPAAAFASLATFGANAAPAAAAVTGTVALSESLALVSAAFENGGLVTGGSGTKDDVLARLTGGEFVVNRFATAQNRALLEQVNSGVGSRPSSVSVGNGQQRINVQVVHDGSTSIRVQPLSDGQIRIIAKQEAHKAVQETAPSVIANDLANPNSRTSKAVIQNHSVSRRR